MGGGGGGGEINGDRALNLGILLKRGRTHRDNKEGEMRRSIHPYDSIGGVEGESICTAQSGGDGGGDGGGWLCTASSCR